MKAVVHTSVTPEELDAQAATLGHKLFELEEDLREFFYRLNHDVEDLTDEEEKAFMMLDQVVKLIEVAAVLYPYDVPDEG